MSEASLKLIVAESLGEISTIKTTDDGKALLLRFHAKIARDAAEAIYIHCMGYPEAVISGVYERCLTRVLEAIQETYEEWGLSDEAFTFEAMECAGNAFHARFMELDANDIGGPLQ